MTLRQPLRQFILKMPLSDHGCFVGRIVSQNTLKKGKKERNCSAITLFHCSTVYYLTDEDPSDTTTSVQRDHFCFRSQKIENLYFRIRSSCIPLHVSWNDSRWIRIDNGCYLLLPEKPIRIIAGLISTTHQFRFVFLENRRTIGFLF